MGTWCLGQEKLHHFTVTIIDADSRDGVPFAMISLKQDGKIVQTGPTNFDGKCQFRQIPGGSYTLVATLGSPWKKEIKKALLVPEEIGDVKLITPPANPDLLDELEVIEYEIPLKDPKK